MNCTRSQLLRANKRKNRWEPKYKVGDIAYLISYIDSMKQLGPDPVVIIAVEKDIPILKKTEYDYIDSKTCMYLVAKKMDYEFYLNMHDRLITTDVIENNLYNWVDALKISKKMNGNV